MDTRSILYSYLSSLPLERLDAGMVAYVAALEKVSQVAPSIASRIVNELKDQRSHLKLIASENFSSLSCQLAMGNLMTDKYAELSLIHI